MALWLGDHHCPLPHVFACFRHRLSDERRERLCRDNAQHKRERQGCILYVGQTPVWNLFRAGISIRGIRPVSHPVGAVLKFRLPCSDSFLIVPPSSTAIEERLLFISDDSVSIFAAAVSGFDGLLLPTVPERPARAVVQPSRIGPLLLWRQAPSWKNSSSVVCFYSANPRDAIEADLRFFCHGAADIPGAG